MPLTNPKHVAVSINRLSQMKIWREVLIATRFGLVGIVATAVHILVVWLLLTQAGITPISANTLAFLTAFGVSFAGNYLWTFRSPGGLRRAILRFFFIALCAFSVNTIILEFLVRGGWFPPIESAIFSVSAVPLVSFIVSRLWAFK